MSELNQIKKTYILHNFNYYRSFADSATDASSVKQGHPNNVANYYYVSSLECKSAINCAAILRDFSAVTSTLDYGIELAKKGEAEQKEYEPRYEILSLFYALISSDVESCRHYSERLLSFPDKNWVTSQELKFVYASISALILNRENEFDTYLAKVKKQCSLKKKRYPPSTYDALVALKSNEKSGFISAIDEMLNEHHTLADNPRYFFYNMPESFYCEYAVVLVAYAKLFKSMDVADELKNDKQILRLKISSFTEGDDIDRKTRYDVPVDYMYLAKLNTTPD